MSSYSSYHSERKARHEMMMAIALVGGGALLALSSWRSSGGILVQKTGVETGIHPPRPKRNPGKSTPLTYTLHLGCENSDLIAKHPNFFSGDYSSIVEARLVYHNYDVRSPTGGSSSGFFEWDKGLKMNSINLQTGDLKTFEITTNKINFEYGFALKNAQGHILYEIGEDNKSPLDDAECTYTFGKYRNRVVTHDWKAAETLGFIDHVFGSCKENCLPGDVNDPWSWSEEAKALGSAQIRSYPPTGLNGQFMMFGENKNGICTMNLHTQRGTCDDILIHFDPRPKTNTFITDNQRCGVWQSQYEVIDWDTAELGSVQENDETKWKFVFQYHTDGLNILLNGDFYHKYGWDSQDGGYNTVSYIQIEYLNDKHYRQGEHWEDPGVSASDLDRAGRHGCTLVALMPPRTPLGAEAFDEP